MTSGKARIARGALVALAAGGAAFAAEKARHAHAHTHMTPLWADSIVTHVPHVKGSINLDGDTDDSGWRGPVLRTGSFVGADGVTPVHPVSQARIVWGDDFLYLNLYAADEDILAVSKGPDSLSPNEDFFHVELKDETTERTFDVNPMGIVTDAIRPRRGGAPPDRSWESHVHVSHELDGTVNKPSDNDEEWVLEMAIPFSSLGLTGAPGERLGISMRRCDTPHHGARVCGSWGEVGKPRELVLDAP
jgi:hypothetical protein